MTNLKLTWIILPDEAELAEQVTDLASRAEAADGIAPLSEQFVLGLQDARLGHRHLLALEDGRVVGAAALAENEAEFVVDPKARRRGIGARLYAGLAEDVTELKVWAHGNTEGAQALAARRETRVTRRLLVMEVSGDALRDSVDFTAPRDMTAADLADSRRRWGDDPVEQAWLEVNNDAFSWHPEQGGWDLARLRRAMEVEWFNPRDVWFIWDTPAKETPGEKLPALAGFHWTKWHDEDTAEVYVVGLSGDYRGRGLGGPVVSMGLAHLAQGGAQRVILYVEDDNEAAVKRYRALGFTVAEEHVVYA